jgi:hypothetical protein
MLANIVDNKYLQSSNGRRWWCETELSSTYDDFSGPSTAKFNSILTGSRSHRY